MTPFTGVCRVEKLLPDLMNSLNPGRIRFLLGPAGSGKTHRCLEEIRCRLKESPDGPPLALLAPKQATFQLERQILSSGEIQGFSRLHIFSFERLAEQLLEHFHQPPPPLLSSEGRLMVLRSLLIKHLNQLRVFRASSRLPGFASQLSDVLRELQNYKVPAHQLQTLAEKESITPAVRNKLHDLALLYRAYQDWLTENGLSDADALLDIAIEAVHAHSTGVQLHQEILFDALWLDGFAEMTPQEQALLAAAIPSCRAATIAFCLEPSVSEQEPLLSIWSLVSQTFRNVYALLSTVADSLGEKVSVTCLDRDLEPTRFSTSPALKHLASHWNEPQPAIHSGAFDEIEWFECLHAEEEARLAARTILHFVRETPGARFRDCAVIVRRLDEYQDVLRRVFQRYEIPCFLDRRQPVSHHPVAELTRSAIRCVLHHYRHDDFFACLKTGLLPVREEEVDELENLALAHGWDGSQWRRPIRLPDNSTEEARIEKLRCKLIKPFEALASAVRRDPTGPELVQAIRTFWKHFQVGDSLERWSRELGENPMAGWSSAIHATVWDQMQDWLDNLGRGFPHQNLPMADWMAILEAGLANLTVGVIPPSIDQVLAGAVDRSRNPDLRLVVVMGLNEGVFPSPPPRPVLLTEREREELEEHRLCLPTGRLARLGHERYYGYIAFTRPREKLVLTSSTRDSSDRPLNPSPFLSLVQRMFPSLQPASTPSEEELTQAEHASELVTPWLKSHQNGQARSALNGLDALVEHRVPGVQWLQHYRQLQFNTSIHPTIAHRLYGDRLLTSVSALEQFAACQFRFFINEGLRAQERLKFEIDNRRRGAFQHEILAKFHEQLQNESKAWRDLTPQEARERIQTILAEVSQSYKEGIFHSHPRHLVDLAELGQRLEDCVAMCVQWMSQYRFDPAAVELEFGRPTSPLPAWEIHLDNGRVLSFRGTIDRVDLSTTGDGHCVVIDYKSASHAFDPLQFAHGIQMQLPAYLAALTSLPKAKERFGLRKLHPAGMFYLNMTGQFDPSRSRADAFDSPEEQMQNAYQHCGRFVKEALPLLDASGSPKGTQFRFTRKKDGSLSKRQSDGVAQIEFQELLGNVQELLRQMGNDIYSGKAEVNPYRLSQNKCACDFCELKAVCRIDPWTHPFRSLKSEPARGTNTGEKQI